MKVSKQIMNNMIISGNKYIPSEYRTYTEVSTFLHDKIVERKVSKKIIFVSIDVPESIGYKYLDGRRVVPRDVFIKFLIAFELNLEDIQYYLLNFGYANLYIKNKRDNAIIYCLINEFSYLELKQYLQKHDIQTL